MQQMRLEGSSAQHLEILLNKYNEIKQEEESKRVQTELQNVYKEDPLRGYKLKPNHSQAGYKRKGYYAPTNPYEDLEELINHLKEKRLSGTLEQQLYFLNEPNSALKARPKHFMLKHQDYFEMKSLMLQDPNNMSYHE